MWPLRQKVLLTQRRPFVVLFNKLPCFSAVRVSCSRSWECMRWKRRGWEITNQPPPPESLQESRRIQELQTQVSSPAAASPFPPINSKITPADEGSPLLNHCSCFVVAGWNFTELESSQTAAQATWRRGPRTCLQSCLIIFQTHFQ